MINQVAIVTGSNKGLGFAIVRGLCKRFEGVVYLTSRDVERGKKAVEKLNKEGLKPQYHQLDITDTKSIEAFRDYIKNKYGGIDVLVNHADIAFKSGAPEPAEETLFVNYFSLVSTCDILFPLLKNGAKVINVSSSAGRLRLIPSKELQAQLRDEQLTVLELSKLMQQYVDAAKQGTHAAEWGNSSYVVSKVGVCVLSPIQHRMLKSRDIKVTAVQPGYADTTCPRSSHKAPPNMDTEAAAALFLALDADDFERAKFDWYMKQVFLC